MESSLDSARALAKALEAPTEVLPWLLVGSFGAAEQEERLQELAVTHLVSLVGAVPASAVGYECLKLDVSDSGESDLSLVLREFEPFVEQARKAGARVLVFCNLGVNRSAAVVAAYLQSALGWTFEAALSHLQRVRPAVSVHERYLEQLRSLGV